MDWLWPDWLLLLGLVPLLIVFYIRIMRRRRFAAHYSSLSLVREAMPSPSWLRKHLPFVLFLLALASLILAMGRPLIPVNVLSGRTTIMLTMDISKSMCMRDIQPTRLSVAKGAALSFVDHQVLGTQVGVVAFAGFAELAQRPTNDISVLEYTIENLATATNTAIGSGILRSLDAIAEVDHNVAKSHEIARSARYAPEFESSSQHSKQTYVPHIIVLLTDGASNSGPDPLLAAGQAAARGVRIFTIGFGTTRSAVMDCRSDIIQADSSDLRPGSGGFGAEPDAVTLKQIAEMTGGKFYSATDAAELQLVFQHLHQYVALTNQAVEIGVYFAALGAVLIMAASILSLFWHPVL
jgi:Ca-activated chloride channel family protein